MTASAARNKRLIRRNFLPQIIGDHVAQDLEGLSRCVMIAGRGSARNRRLAAPPGFP
jgi:hypothetical protein